MRIVTHTYDQLFAVMLQLGWDNRRSLLNLYPQYDVSVLHTLPVTMATLYDNPWIENCSVYVHSPGVVGEVVYIKTSPPL